MLVEVEENVRQRAGRYLDGLGLSVHEAVRRFLEFLAQEKRCPSAPDLTEVVGRRAGGRPSPPGCRRRVTTERTAAGRAWFDLGGDFQARRLFLVEPPEGMEVSEWRELICRVNVPPCQGRRS